LNEHDWLPTHAAARKLFTGVRFTGHDLAPNLSDQHDGRVDPKSGNETYNDVWQQRDISDSAFDTFLVSFRGGKNIIFNTVITLIENFQNFINCLGSENDGKDEID
jgi:hypothetical protein